MACVVIRDVRGVTAGLVGRFGAVREKRRQGDGEESEQKIHDRGPDDKRIGVRHNHAHDVVVKRRAVVVSVLVLSPLAAGWWASEQLAHPPRRALQDYHREFLADPSAHGVVVKTFTCDDGTPCLVCEPASDGHLGKRGEVIRDQLAGRNAGLRPAGQVTGNLVLVHGRRGRKEDYLLIAERFCAVGFRCILPDLPAHGDHPGQTACFGVKESQIPLNALNQAAARFGFEAQPAGLMGISMGGAVSLRGAAEKEAPWRAAVFVATFDALENVVRHQSTSLAGSWGGALLQGITSPLFEWKSGVKLQEANSAALAPKLHCPVMIAHGTADRVIPLECGRRLYEALPAAIEKRWVEIPGADHDNVLITDVPIYAEMAAWFLARVPN